MWFGKNKVTKVLGTMSTLPPVGDGSASIERGRETMRALELGKLPSAVSQRLTDAKEGRLPWTSDLSVNEWAALRKYGFEPLGQVMGSSMYHVGYSINQSAGMWTSCDLSYPERALYEGRRLASDRLQAEARALGANAVVGMRIQVRGGLEDQHTEFVAFGTAVRVPGLDTPRDPVLCTVTGQDLVRLLQNGSLPVGLAMGVCVHYRCASRQDMWQMGSWSNQEMVSLTEAVYHTRSQALGRLHADGRNLGATDVLASQNHFDVREISVERGENDEREDHIIEFFTLGTAVVRGRVGAPMAIESVLNLHN